MHQCANPIDELWRKTARNRISKSEDNVRRVGSSGGASEVDVHQNQTRPGNRQFVCNNKLNANAGQNRDGKTKQDRSIVRFECDSDESTSCGACEGERGQKQARRKHGSEDEGWKEDPNFVDILLSSSVGSEMASECLPVPQPLAVDSGAAATVHTEDVISKPQQMERN